MMSFFERVLEFFDLKEEKDGVQTVTVKKGDSLWAIAERVTGKGENWKEIVAANPGTAWDEKYTLQIDEVLNLPESWREEKERK